MADSSNEAGGPGGAGSPLLEIRDLHVSAGDLTILRGVDLTINAGEVHAIRQVIIDDGSAMADWRLDDADTSSDIDFNN